MTGPSVLLSLAGRNLVRQGRRTLLIATAMMLDVAVLIFFLGLGDGMCTPMDRHRRSPGGRTP
ncbi:MAG: hypothetical protein R2882_15175 [Gemmatimonadales bacterium]